MSKLLRIAATTLALSAVALPALAADKTPGGDPVVARVNSREIHRSDLARVMQAMGPQAQQIPPQMLYPQLLQKLILTRLVADQGYAQKLQNDAEVKDRLKLEEEQIVADVYIRRAIQPKITDDKIKARYEELAGKFKPEDEVRASHILVKTEAEANDIIKQLKDGADFAKLAADKSTDTGSAKQGGDLGYFAKGAMVAPFADAAFSMKNGEVSTTPVKTEFGYHVIKVVDHRKSSAPPLSEVKDQITNQIGQEMMQQMVKDLQAKAKIERFNPDGTPLKAEAEKPAADSDKK